MKIFATISEDGDGYTYISRISLNPHNLRETESYESKDVFYHELTEHGFIDCTDIERWKKHKF
jgi:hypothetical protein